MAKEVLCIAFLLGALGCASTPVASSPGAVTGVGGPDVVTVHSAFSDIEPLVAITVCDIAFRSERLQFTRASAFVHRLRLVLDMNEPGDFNPRFVRCRIENLMGSLVHVDGSGGLEIAGRTGRRLTAAGFRRLKDLLSQADQTPGTVVEPSKEQMKNVRKCRESLYGVN